MKTQNLYSAPLTDRIRLTIERFRHGSLVKINGLKFRPIQMQVNELSLIVNTLKSKEKPNFLIFGFGYDTPFWINMNSQGKTVFIEDNPNWFNAVKTKFPQAQAHLVTYPNNSSMWQELIDKPDQLKMELPSDITSTKWDVILVDAPLGKVGVEFPGRMSSIYMASQLVAPNGDILVHDCNRPIEDAYANKYLGIENLVNEAYGRSILRLYHNN